MSCKLSTCDNLRAYANFGWARSPTWEYCCSGCAESTGTRHTETCAKGQVAWYQLRKVKTCTFCSNLPRYDPKGRSPTCCDNCQQTNGGCHDNACAAGQALWDEKLCDEVAQATRASQTASGFPSAHLKNTNGNGSTARCRRSGADLDPPVPKNERKTATGPTAAAAQRALDDLAWRAEDLREQAVRAGVSAAHIFSAKDFYPTTPDSFGGVWLGTWDFVFRVIEGIRQTAQPNTRWSTCTLITGAWGAGAIKNPLNLVYHSLVVTAKRYPRIKVKYVLSANEGGKSYPEMEPISISHNGMLATAENEARKSRYVFLHNFAGGYVWGGGAMKGGSGPEETIMQNVTNVLWSLDQLTPHQQLGGPKPSDWASRSVAITPNCRLVGSGERGAHWAFNVISAASPDLRNEEWRRCGYVE